jgi:hypothetical protein
MRAGDSIDQLPGNADPIAGFLLRSTKKARRSGFLPVEGCDLGKTTWQRAPGPAIGPARRRNRVERSFNRAIDKRNAAFPTRRRSAG